jgi:hypothetical protein
MASRTLQVVQACHRSCALRVAAELQSLQVMLSIMFFNLSRYHGLSYCSLHSFFPKSQRIRPILLQIHWRLDLLVPIKVLLCSLIELQLFLSARRLYLH